MAVAFASTERLWPWSLFAALIAAAGLPIYIHAPKVYVEEYGVGLTALGLVLAGLRLLDVVQDPVLGWLATRYRDFRAAWVTGAVALMALSMLALFAVPPPVAPLLWFALCLTGLFTAFSFLTIVFYAQGVERAADMGPLGHTRLAGWRETGSLIGVSLASVAPVALLAATANPFAAFAVGFALIALVAWAAMRGNWQATGTEAPLSGLSAFAQVLRDPLSRRLLLLGLVNSAPVAITSTLFLFFVESRLALPGWEGAFLLIFFLGAAASAPLWSRLGQHFGDKKVLLAGMVLSVLSFLWAATLTEGQGVGFALICLTSGAALGADTVLLPALFARRLGQIGGAAAGFGLWAFVTKLSLALAAATLLPALQQAGFTPGPANSADALSRLSLLYAVLPTALKLLALGLLTFTRIERA